VPELAAVLERYGENSEASTLILATLVDLGLIRMAPDPDQRGEVLLDSRPLQAMLARYGPRVTTASGRLGVSATKPEIWTPGAASGGGSPGIWTPGAGSSTPPQTGGGKLIVPGR
jgi:hypothetical protein